MTRETLECRIYMAEETMYPRCAELTSTTSSNPGQDYGSEYEFGLDLILDGSKPGSRHNPGLRCRE